MTVLDILAAISLIGAVLYVLTSAVRGGNLHIPWTVPALMFIAFAAYSLFTVASAGLFGFWPLHTANLWGLQVWMDLLFSVVIAWVFLVPRAKAAGMSILPWGIFTACTASIGLWAMMARVLWLEQRAASTQPA